MRETDNKRPLRAAPARHAAAVGLLLSGCALAGCSRDSQTAAQSARIASLEDEVSALRASLEALSAGALKAAPPSAAAGQAKPFHIECPQPWLLHTPLGATLWTCRSPRATSEGYYPQCSITLQPQLVIETRNYFEFAWNASPQLREVKALKDQPLKVKGRDAFAAVYEADAKSIPFKMRSVLIPDAEQVYAVTCFAPSASFADYDTQAFQKIIDTITFDKESPQ